MNTHQKTNFISVLLLLACALISVILYFVFHIVFIFLIFIPPVIYYILKKRDQNGSKEISDRFGNSN
ncbi:MAG: hypothetical protein HYV29_12845 [Ignavibacteriales bacterium]|nr:hypothetical protein [Ignavibacteriales bacterium]